jgi:LacI family transcriptional regulator
VAKLADVARRAGVSPATVSRALNEVPTVDPVLARKVKEAAQELGYRPNAVALNLRRRRTDVWALVVSDIGNPFITAVVRGVEDVAQANGFSVVLCNADEDPRKEADYLAVAEQEQVAGAILTPTALDTDASPLTRAGIPVVTVDRPLLDPVDTVIADSRWGAGVATRHLLDEGWRRPACITGPGSKETAEERLRGYLDALAERAVGGRRHLVRHVAYDVEGGRAGASSLLGLRTPPDAFLVASSMMALGVLQELQARGLRPGEDVGLVSFDDAPWATLLDPPLSVVTQPAYDIGTHAATLLNERVRHRDLSSPPRTVVLPTRLVVRGSSRSSRQSSARQVL